MAPKTPTALDVKNGDASRSLSPNHVIQADFTGLIPPSKPDSFRLPDHPELGRP